MSFTRDHGLIVANGVWNDSESVFGWTDRAEQWFEDRGMTTRRYECECRWTLRHLWYNGPRYANAISEIARGLLNFRKHAVFHSFACDFGIRGILQSGVIFETVVLIQGAVTSNCDRNGIAALLKSGQADRVIVTASKNDAVLRAARWWPPIDNVWKPLGIYGPSNQFVWDKIETQRWDHHGHSTMWRKPHDTATFEWIRSHITGDRAQLNPDDHTKFDHE